MDKKFRIKFIIIIILALLNLLGLGYLNLKPSSAPSVKPQESTEPPAGTGTPETQDTTVPETPAEIPGVWMPQTIAAIRERAATAAEEVKPAPETEPEPVYIDYDYYTQDSLMRLVNKQNPVDASYVPEDLIQADVPSDYPEYLRKEAAEALRWMFDEAGNEGYHLMLVDGYRSYTEQRSLYYTYLERYGSSVVSTMDAHPGASEHQLGLAVDLGTQSRTCNLRSCFADTDTYTWLKENAWKYGWIERYPYGKTNVTGINYSPWHYRYVGTDLARDIHESGLTMEEYVQQ